MTYRSTKVYDTNLLTKFTNYREAIARSVQSFESAKDNIQVGFLCATLYLMYPDPNMVRNTSIGWQAKVMDLTKRVDHCFQETSWTLTKQQGNLFGVFDFSQDAFPIKISAPRWRDFLIKSNKKIELVIYA